jgi:uncharacterized membrane protein YqjE
MGAALLRQHICKARVQRRVQRLLLLESSDANTAVRFAVINAPPQPQVLVEQEAGDVLLAGLAAVLLHFVFLTFHVLITWLARCPELERKAIIVMASQKNL